jgi:hypothetical protein
VENFENFLFASLLVADGSCNAWRKMSERLLPPAEIYLIYRTTLRGIFSFVRSSEEGAITKRKSYDVPRPHAQQRWLEN